jgi:molybdopterin-guanine dinucleotide biosynthesis protein A
MPRVDVTLAGIFVGGAGARMGGHPKGLLPLPSGPTLVERWVSLLEKLGIRSVLVGSRPEYAELPLEVVADEPSGVGPLGGLAGLLARAADARVIAVACDMPYVEASLVERLAAHAPQASIVAPRRDNLWEPLFARYDARVVLPLARARAATARRSLQGLLDEAKATPLPLEPAEWEELRDWDTWDAVNRDARTRGS